MLLSQEKRELLSFMREADALQFGAFTLKSGRVSPYFFNSARFRTGALLERLGVFYGRTIAQCAPQATVVFGPAYKGIPLCVAAAMALSRQTGRQIGYLFDRKEAKGHGDKGLFVGVLPEPGEHVVLVDDVITDGQTKLEAVALLRTHFDIQIDALVIAFNRMELDPAGEDAVRRFENSTGVPVTALLSLADLEAELSAAAAAPGEALVSGADVLARIRDYRRQYGVPDA